MENFSLLGSLVIRLHQEFINLFYVLLPIFFALAIVMDWFRSPTGSADFLDTLKRAFVATLLVAGFQEISDAILIVTSGIADKISDMQGLDTYIHMAGDKAKSYPMSPMSIVLGFDDLFVGLLTFCSYVLLYIARYITVALYHFMWMFLSILSPLLMLFHLFRGTSQVTLNLFKSLIEVACWKIVWAVLSVMMTTLAFGNAMSVDGNYLTVVLLNFVIALAMLGTPLIVKSLVGAGLAGMGETLGMGAVIAMVSAPAKTASVLNRGRHVLSDTAGFTRNVGQGVKSGIDSTITQGFRPAFTSSVSPSRTSDPSPPPPLPTSPPPRSSSSVKK